MKTGIELIAEERERQVSQERWTAEHDDRHKENQLLNAAGCYIQHVIGRGWLLGSPLLDALSHIKNGKSLYRKEPRPRDWPWAKRWWKPKGKIEDLVRAGALIAAEIDRIQRTKS